MSYSPKPLTFEDFGSYKYDGGQHLVAPSDAEKAGITTRQSIINSLLPDLGMTGEQRAGQIANFSDLFTQRLLQQALPRFTGDFYKRGLEGSTAYSKGFGDLLAEAAQRGIFAGEDLMARDEQSKINRLGAAESGLQNAFSRLLNIANTGKSFNDQYFAVETGNANRQAQFDLQNLQNAFSTQQGGLNDLGNLAALGSSMVFQNGGIFNGGNPGAVSSNAASSTLSKTGNSKSWGDVAKDPNTWVQLAQLAAMAGAACWVAAEIFGGMYNMKTVYARAYIKRLAPEWFFKFYMKRGRELARKVRRSKTLQRKLRPIFEGFAEKGKMYLEDVYGSAV